MISLEVKLLAALSTVDHFFLALFWLFSRSASVPRTMRLNQYLDTAFPIERYFGVRAQTRRHTQDSGAFHSFR
jgi:hypothetical protein